MVVLQYLTHSLTLYRFDICIMEEIDNGACPKSNIKNKQIKEEAIEKSKYF